LLRRPTPLALRRRRGACCGLLAQPAAAGAAHHKQPRRGCHATATINFYRFRAAPLDGGDELLRAHAPAVRDLCTTRGVVGTVILAAEGVNGSLAGRLEAVRDVVHAVTTTPPEHWLHSATHAVPAVPTAAALAAPELVTNEEVFHVARDAPFGKLKVKVKPEIVTMRLEKPLDMSRRYA
jgi:predicted sulfurtransferase